MTKTLRWFLVTLLAIAAPLAWAGVTSLDVANAQTACNNAGFPDQPNCEQAQNGSNTSRTSQSGSSKSGDAVGGQVTGVVSSGATSVDASNTTRDSSATSGDASATNTGRSFTGLANVPEGTGELNFLSQATGSACNGADTCDQAQNGANRSSFSQSANAVTGDAVAGEVTGVVTAAGGSASVVVANDTERSDALTGDSTASNDLHAFTGLLNDEGNDGDANNILASQADGSACNAPHSPSCEQAQNGANTFRGTQSANATTGDAVAGQVNGVVAGGRTSLDARNTTLDSSATSGDSTSDNTARAFTGLLNAEDNNDVNVLASQAADSACNGSDRCDQAQNGSNRGSLSQTAQANSGDAVAGQVSGIVTSAGGSASVVVANTTERTDSLSGDGTFSNDNAGFVGIANVEGNDDISFLQ